jgi:hypothetical protein
MALVHKGFSTFGLFGAFYASLTEAALSQKFEPIPRQMRHMIVAAGVGYVGRFAHLRDSEYCWRWSRQRASPTLPGSVLDARYKGLTAHAAYLDAAICRRVRLR